VFLLIWHLKYSAILSKIHSFTGFFFCDFAHWVFIVGINHAMRKSISFLFVLDQRD